METAAAGFGLGATLAELHKSILAVDDLPANPIISHHAVGNAEVKHGLIDGRIRLAAERAAPNGNGPAGSGGNCPVRFADAGYLWPFMNMNRRHATNPGYIGIPVALHLSQCRERADDMIPLVGKLLVTGRCERFEEGAFSHYVVLKSGVKSAYS